MPEPVATPATPVGPDGPGRSLVVRVVLKGRESEARDIGLAVGESLEPRIWEYLRELKVERDSFSLFNDTRGRRLDPGWPIDQAGLTDRDTLVIGDALEFPDPLAGYRAFLKAIVQAREWPITEERGAALLAERARLGVSAVEHQTCAREAGMPPDDAQVLLDWKPERERLVDEYRILLKLARTSPTVPEAAVRKMGELRSKLGMTPEEHVALSVEQGLDEAIAGRLLEGTAPVPKTHQEYLGALVSARESGYSSDSLNRLKDLVLKHGISRDAHRKLAFQATIPQELADACFEDQEGLPTGRRFYVRELLIAAKARPGGESFARLKEMRERYTIKRPEHNRHCRDWGIGEVQAEALWELEAPPPPVSKRSIAMFGVLVVILVLATPFGQGLVRGVGQSVAGIFRPGPGSEGDGFDRNGYDKDGFDRQGFNRQGYDREGFDKQGLDKSGYDRRGFNREGRDRKGFDHNGLDKQGYDKRGLDRDGFDRQGYDWRGYDRTGFNRKGYNAQGYNRDGFNAKGFDRSGYDRNGRDREGYDRHGIDKDGFNRLGLDKDGYDRKGFNKEGWTRDGFDKKGYDKEGYDKEGYDKDGLNRAGYDRKGFNRDGRDKDNYDRQGFDPAGYDRAGYDKKGFNRDGLNRQGFDRNGRDRNGYDPSGFDRLGFDRTGYNKEGFDRRGFDRSGWNKEGFDRDGYDRDGINRQGRNRQGEYRDGRDRDGRDAQGFNRDGYSREGYGRDGSDLLPSPLATVQGESGTWVLRVGRAPGKIAEVGDRIGPKAVEVVKIGGNVVVFKYKGVQYDRKLNR